jgi:hypothetical protein
VLREGKTFTVDVTPATGPTGKGSIGIGINARINHIDDLKASNPIEVDRYILYARLFSAY